MLLESDKLKIKTFTQPLQTDTIAGSSLRRLWLLVVWGPAGSTGSRCAAAGRVIASTPAAAAAPGRIGRARQRVNASTHQQSDLRLPAVRRRVNASTRQIRFHLFQSTKPQPGHWKPQCETTAWPLECPKSELRVNASTRPVRVPDSPCGRAAETN